MGIQVLRVKLKSLLEILHGILHISCTGQQLTPVVVPVGVDLMGAEAVLPGWIGKTHGLADHPAVQEGP